MTGMRDHLFGCACEKHVGRPWNRPEHWSKAEVAYLERHYGMMTDEAIAKKLGRTVWGVRLKAKRLDIRKRDIGHSSRDVARLLGVEESAVSKVWIKRGLLPATAGFEIGGGRRQWVVTDAGIETFIREHGHWIDARRVPEDSPFKALAMANAWISLTEVAERTGHSAHWLVWYFHAGLFPVRRKGTHWYMPAADAPKLPVTNPGALYESHLVRRDMLARRNAKRKGIAA